LVPHHHPVGTINARGALGFWDRAQRIEVLKILNYSRGLLSAKDKDKIDDNQK
jgi:hypothetical protein